MGRSESDGSEASGGLGRIAARGASLALSGQGLLFLIQLTSVVVLARLLTETDYGLISMVVAFLGVGHLLRDFGLSAAAIQAKTLSREHRDNLFWLNSGVGALLMVAALLLAPLIAAFYNRPEVDAIVRALSPTLLLSGLATQYRASLIRKLRFGGVAIGDVIGAVAGLAVALIAALGGAGYWALVFQQIVSGAVTLTVCSALAGWLPRRYTRTTSMKSLLTFGLPLLGSQILTYATNNLDSVLMGRIFGTVPLGLYNRGIQIVRIPMNQMRGPLGTLALSVLAKVQDNDERFIRFVARGQLVMAYPLLTAAGTIAATAPLVVAIVLGDRWVEAADFVRLVAIGEGLTTLSAVGAWIYTSRGHSGALMRYTVFSAVVKITLLLFGSRFGPIGIACAFAAAPVLLWPISLWRVGCVSKLPTGALILSSYRFVAVVGGASLLCWWVGEFTLPILGAPLAVLAAVLTQLAALACLSIFPPVRRDYLEFLATIRMARKGHERR